MFHSYLRSYLIFIFQPIILPSLFLSPSTPLKCMLHMLDVRRSLAFYIDRTKRFRKATRLLLCFHGPNKGSPASPQTLARWIVQTVSLAYELTGKTPTEPLKAHSTRALFTSTAFQRGIEIPHICHEAMWSNPSTFVTHYHLDVWAKKDAAFGRAVLTSFLP